MKNANTFIHRGAKAKSNPLIPEGFDRDCFETDQRVFNWLDRKFCFKMDLAADPNNWHSQKCPEFFGPDDDALSRPWPRSGFLFVNPPFSQAKEWVKKCQLERDAGCRIVSVVNSSVVQTIYYHRAPADLEMRVIGRLPFSIQGVPIHGNFSNNYFLVWNKRMRKDGIRVQAVTVDELLGEK